MLSSLNALPYNPPTQKVIWRVGRELTHLFGKPGEEVTSPQEVQDQVELAFSLKGCGRRQG